MLASAVRDYATNFGVAVGDKVAIFTNNDDAYRTAITLHEIGVTVPVIIDARSGGGGELAHHAKELGIRVENGKAISKVFGKKGLKPLQFVTTKNLRK